MRGISLRSLHGVVSGMTKTAVRFPLPLVCAVLFAAITVARTHRLDLFDTQDMRHRLLLLLGLGFFLFLSIKLFAERRSLGTAPHLTLTAIGIVLISLQVFWIEPIFYWTSPALLFVGPALVLSVMIAPFGLGKGEQAAFWNFNRSAWQSAAFAFLAATVLALGLMAVLAALERLFGIDVASELYGDTWALSWSVFWPWLALAGVTDEFPVPEDADCPKPIVFLITYVTVPLATAYLALLYAYIAKSVVQGSLPDGEIGYLVSGFAIFGVATHLLAYPLRESGLGLVRLFHRHFYHALFAPACLLAVAIGVRVSQYGVSEARFAVMVFAAWMFAMVAVFTFWRRRTIVIVPMSLAVVFVLSSFGPWGASAVATYSQVGRLERLLTESGLLAEGRIAPVQGSILWEERKKISAIVHYLHKSGKLDALRPWFPDDGSKLASATSARAVVTDLLGFDYVNYWDARPRVQFTAFAPENFLEVGGYPLLGKIRIGRGGWVRPDILGDPATGAKYHFYYDKDAAVLRIAGPSDDEVRFDFGAIVKQLLERTSRDDPDRNLSFDRAEGALRVRLRIENLNAELDGERARISSATFLILVDRPDAAR